jgi:hypothetical protein
VTAYAGTGIRIGEVIAGGQRLVVTQSGPGTSFSFAPPTAHVSKAGASGLSTTASGTSASYVFYSTRSWLTITNWNPSNGMITYNVAANTGGPRTGQILIGSDAFTVTQDGVDAGTPWTNAAGNGRPPPGNGTRARASTARR